MSHSSPDSMTCVTKAVVCAILYCLGMVHIKESLDPCYNGSRFIFLITMWSFTICPMPYNHNQNVLSALLNKKVSVFLEKHFIPSSLAFLLQLM